VTTLNDPNGIYFPDSVLEEFTLGVLKASRLASLPGIHQYKRPAGSPVRIPLIDSDSVDAGYVPELGQIALTEVEGTELILLPPNLMAIKTLALISNEALAATNNDFKIDEALVAKVAKLLDQELIAGTGETVGVGDTARKKILGLVSKAGIQDTTVAPLTIERLMAARAEIETAHETPGYLIGHPKMFLSLYQQRVGTDQEGQFLIDPVTGYGQSVAGFVPISTPAAPWDGTTKVGTAVAFASAAIAVALERDENQVASSAHSHFDRDGVALRVAQRADVGVINGPAVVRMEVGPEA
jgi:HK97 family phage major capsid protein